MGRKPEVGDVFTLPLPDGRFGVGQLVREFEKSRGYFYAVAYDETLSADRVSPDAAFRAALSAPIVMALTMDTLISAGRWQILGNVTFDAARLRFPTYKVASGRRHFDVLDEQGQTLRRASRVEAETLREQTFVAPIRLEKALCVLKAAEPWDPDYSELLLAVEPGSDRRSWVNPAR